MFDTGSVTVHTVYNKEEKGISETTYETRQANKYCGT